MPEESKKNAKKMPGKPFKKGYDPRREGNGRPKGSKNFKTLFEEAVKELAEEYEEADDAQKDIIHKGLQKAAEGDFRFFSYLIDRLHGKPTNKTDITSGGEKLPGNKIQFVDFSEDAEGK